MKKHNFSVSPIERRYSSKYGELPDTTYMKLVAQGINNAGYVVNTRMNIIWREMRQEHEEELRCQCPFLT